MVALGKELSTYAITSMLCYTHVISCDWRFFALFTCEIPHVTYRKFNTGISNELASQRERTIVDGQGQLIAVIADAHQWDS